MLQFAYLKRTSPANSLPPGSQVSLLLPESCACEFEGRWYSHRQQPPAHRTTLLLITSAPCSSHQPPTHHISPLLIVPPCCSSHKAPAYHMSPLLTTSALVLITSAPCSPHQPPAHCTALLLIALACRTPHQPLAHHATLLLTTSALCFTAQHPAQHCTMCWYSPMFNSIAYCNSTVQPNVCQPTDLHQAAAQ